MKKFILSLLKAAVYVGVFLGIQVLVTLVLTVGVTLFEEIRRFVTGEIRDELRLMGDLVSTATVISCGLTLLFLLLVFTIRGKSFSAEVRWHEMPSAGKAMLGPIECGFGISVLSSFVLALIPFPESWFASYDESMELMLAGNPLWMAVSAVIAAPIVEEVIFRGLVYTRLCRGMKRWIAALLSAVIFALVHGTLLHLVYIIPMGLILCLFYEKYRSLWAPILLHMSFNLAGTVLGYYNVESAVTVIILIAAGLYLTVLGLLSMRWYRKDTALYLISLEQTPVVFSETVPNPLFVPAVPETDSAEAVAEPSAQEQDAASSESEGHADDEIMF